MRSTRIVALLFILLFFAALGFAQKKTLLIAEHDGKAAVNHLQHLVRYDFVDGVMITKETILSVPSQKDGVKGDYVRFDLGNCQIYRNRYVITGIGNVIDIKTKKILVTERGKFIAFSGDSIIFYTNDIFKGKYFSVLNVKTEQFKKVEDANYNPLPRPDVEVDEISKPNNISAYYVTGKKDVLVKDAGYGQPQPLLGDDVKRIFPIFWLNNNSFLYANYTKNQQNASIYKVNINKTVEKVAQIDAIPATAASAYFEFGTDGNVVYSCGKGHFSIDLKKKVATKLVYENVGEKFSVETDENATYGRIVKYDNVEIGKKWVNIFNAKTTSDYAAFQNDIVMGGEHYPQGVIVWNPKSKKWVTLFVTSLANIIGWVSE